MEEPERLLERGVCALSGLSAWELFCQSFGMVAITVVGFLRLLLWIVDRVQRQHPGRCCAARRCWGGSRPLAKPATRSRKLVRTIVLSAVITNATAANLFLQRNLILLRCGDVADTVAGAAHSSGGERFVVEEVTPYGDIISKTTIGTVGTDASICDGKHAVNYLGFKGRAQQVPGTPGINVMQLMLLGVDAATSASDPVASTSAGRNMFAMDEAKTVTSAKNFGTGSAVSLPQIPLRDPQDETNYIFAFRNIGT
jgi:hypothetical protein